MLVKKVSILGEYFFKQNITILNIGISGMAFEPDKTVLRFGAFWIVG